MKFENAVVQCREEMKETLTSDWEVEKVRSERNGGVGEGIGSGVIRRRRITAVDEEITGDEGRCRLVGPPWRRRSQRRKPPRCNPQHLLLLLIFLFCYL